VGPHGGIAGPVHIEVESALAGTYIRRMIEVWSLV
jgi:hypothetical protein